MASAMLAQLKLKRQPRRQSEFQIKFPQSAQGVPINIPIVDKRGDPAVVLDRASILAKIRQNLEVRERESGPMPILEREREKAEKAEKAEKPKPVKKLPKKLKLVEDKPVMQEPGSVIQEPGKRVKKAVQDQVQVQVQVQDQDQVQDQVQEPIQIGPNIVLDLKRRLPKKGDQILVRADAYYMNNRQKFINFISVLFEPYKQDIDRHANDFNCDNTGGTGEFSLLTHQKIVRDYVNLVTPYRGVLLYHGLGSGKTCSSIAIAEGMKTDKQVIVMTPASLKTNFIEELKKCGDKLYKKNQYWEFIAITDVGVDQLADALSLTPEFIIANKGAWMVDINKPPNFANLSTANLESLNKQLDEMIKGKYDFIKYNGMRNANLDQRSLNGTINPFSDKVVIIDEAHNFVSRIVNKLGKTGQHLSIRLYRYLMSAENCKIILLTGTPIINYPNELAIAMNMLRGEIKTWSLKLAISNGKVTQESLIALFKANAESNALLDYLRYDAKTTTLQITRNPFGFSTVTDLKSKKYMGVSDSDRISGSFKSDSDRISGSFKSDDNFIAKITAVLNENGITIIPTAETIKKHTCLPDGLKEFASKFVDDDNKLKNMDLFKRRILGLVSYFPDIDALLPRYDKATDLHIIKIPMSDFQLSVYDKARAAERKIESNNAKRMKKSGAGAGAGIFDDSSSTYRIFSRAFCNFVFPAPDIIRPLPNGIEDIATAVANADETNENEDLLDAASPAEKALDADGKYEADELKLETANVDVKAAANYEHRIQEALAALAAKKDAFLSPTALAMYSPKFLNMLNNLTDEKLKGLHLIYSQFRTLEGIGILSLVLKTNGFAQFKIVKTKAGNDWKVDVSVEDMGKPKFVLYTGTENADEKEVIRNIFNGNWSALTPGLRAELTAKSTNNLYGEIIKIIMITASGAEGISLSNVRYVHITEPYWHPVRMEQVVGRARRICSHKDLPMELRTVEVFLYLMTFTDAQIKSDNYKELKKRDVGKNKENGRPLSSDEALYEIATIKEDINKAILKNIKEASVDCNVHTRSGAKDPIQCFRFSSEDPEKFSYTPDIIADDEDENAALNKAEVKIKAKQVTLPDGTKAVFDPVSRNVYTFDSFIRKAPIKIGTLETDEKGKMKFIKV